MAKRNIAFHSGSGPLAGIVRSLCVAAISVAAASASFATETDLAALPLVTSAPQVVKPNLMFVLDDSGSMAWTHMPDDVDNFGQGGSPSFTHKYGYVSSQCNGVYYNPSLTYSPPAQVAANGAVTYYPNASFNSSGGAWNNGFDTLAGKTDLSSAFQAWTKATVQNSALNNTDDGTGVAAYYYKYSGSQLSQAQKDYFDTNSTFYKECNSLIGSSPGSGVFTKVTVSSSSGPGSTDERQNFANWYSYYRTRMLMMKTATGLAFRNIGDQYRIGYMSINNNTSNSLLNISDFNGAQKNSWYSKLYGATTGNSTPIRQALADAGRIYANKVSTLNGVTVTDPVQYSCQKNFTLLSTDGYWNGNAGYQVDGATAVANADAGQQAPFGDGGTVADLYTATVSVTATNSSAQVSSITVNGQKILSATATTSGGGFGTNSQKLARNIVTSINACTNVIAGACQVTGYKATYSGNVVSITAPGAVTATPVVVIANGSYTATAFSGSAVASGGTPDTLADVAMYYYSTDLRSAALGNDIGALGNSVSTDNVLPGGEDAATWQHMNTFTLGLGARGRMVYSATYKSDTSGDFYSIKSGATASASVCTWQASGVCTWPAPAANLPENIDDLWHAAVNGRGQYFSTTDPTSLAVGLNSALQAVTEMTSDSAAATTSNPNVSAGDNYIFSSTFRSGEWYGELERRQIDVVTGQVGASADWAAAAQLDAKASRTIYTFDPAPANKLKSFVWANLTATEKTYFTTTYMQSPTAPSPWPTQSPLSQFCVSGVICLNATAQTNAGGATLVNYLRGERTNEGPADDTTKYFRARTHVLGDIVNSEAVYVRTPQFDYVDSGYAAYKTANATRTPMVYVGANDGMLHAFNANTGDEAWAYVPNMLLPTLYRLADKFYASNHVFYADGSPTISDAYFGGAWHTVLVAGLNDGGRGYYALDVTDPANPKALWEFAPTNMGLTYGRPEIAKLANGTWVAILTSGYNNVNPGNGQGYLYVVNLQTGAQISAIGTNAGSTGVVAGICSTAPCPSGLAQIRAWVDNTRYDNTTTKVYGGDLFGNLWRFDVNNTIAPSGLEAQALATLRGPNPPGAVQSITARPELGKVAGYPVIYVGTGRYLGGSDLTNAEVQSIYAVKDTGGTTSFGNPRSDISATGFVQQTLTDSTCAAGSVFCTPGSTIRTSSSNPVNFATQKGWFVDLPGARERATTDPQLALGTLSVTTNLLDPSACTVGGTSYINFFDYRSGAPIQGAGGMVSVLLGNALATRPVQLKFSDGTVRSLVRMSDNTWQTPPSPIPPSGIGTRRTSWRELIVE